MIKHKEQSNIIDQTEKSISKIDWTWLNLISLQDLFTEPQLKEHEVIVKGMTRLSFPQKAK